MNLRPQPNGVSRGAAGAPRFLSEFRALRAQCGCILAFQRGDFFEFMADDAPVVAMVLDIALTSIPDPETGARIPACGIPAPFGLPGTGLGAVSFVGSSSQYFEKLARARLPFAIALQSPADHGGYAWRIVATYGPDLHAAVLIGGAS